MSSDVIKLSLAKEGNTVRVVFFDGGFSFQKKLISLGINVGCTLKIITKSDKHPILVAIDGTRIALGQGLINSIMVTVIEEKSAIIKKPSFLKSFGKILKAKSLFSQ